MVLRNKFPLNLNLNLWTHCTASLKQQGGGVTKDRMSMATYKKPVRAMAFSHQHISIEGSNIFLSLLELGF